MPLPTPTMRRLTIVKYLHTQALEQERKGGPLAGLALLPFHDAVELFLQVAAETHHLTLRKSVDFIEYWTEFSNADRPLRYQQQMRRFNNARVEVKHRGTLPSQPDVEGVNAGARLHRLPEQRCINDADENAVEYGLVWWASGWGQIIFGRVGVVAA